MALGSQKIPIFFNEGVDTKTDSRLVMGPKLLLLENGVFSRGKGDDAGSISKRYGFRRLGNSIGGTGIYASSSYIEPATGSYSIGGTCNSIYGTGATFRNTIDGTQTDDLTITASGTFTFAETLFPGQTYAITTMSTGSVSQSFTIGNATGTVATSNVTNITIDSTPAFFLSGTVDGLSGSGNSFQLRIRVGGTSEDRVITSDGAWVSSLATQTGETYHVSFLTLPTAQSGSVLNSDGTFGSTDASGVIASLTSSLFTIGGNLTIASGAQPVTLRLTAEGTTEDLEVTGPAPASVPFTFTKTCKSGSSYSVAVQDNGAVVPTTRSIAFDGYRGFEADPGNGTSTYDFSTGFLATMWLKLQPTRQPYFQPLIYQGIPPQTSPASAENPKLYMWIRCPADGPQFTQLITAVSGTVTGTLAAGGHTVNLLGAGDSSGSLVYPDTWHWVALEFSGSGEAPNDRIRCWWDGMEDGEAEGAGILSRSNGTNNIPDVLVSQTGSLYFGDYPDWGPKLGGNVKPFRGAMGEISIWTGSFTRDEIKNIYNAGQWHDLTDLSFSGGELVSWFRPDGSSTNRMRDAVSSVDAYARGSTWPDAFFTDGRWNNMSESFAVSSGDGTVTTSNITDITVAGTTQCGISGALYGLTSSAEPTTLKCWFGVHCMNFDGVNDFLALEASSERDGAVAMTWSWWQKQAALQQAPNAVWSDYGGGSNRPFKFDEISTGGAVLYINGTTYNVYNAGTPGFVTGSWQHCCVVMDSEEAARADQLRFYVDGIHITPDTQTGAAILALQATSNDHALGNNSASYVNPWGGSVCDPAYWLGKPFTQAAVTELYNGGKLLDLSTHSTGSPDFWCRISPATALTSWPIVSNATMNFSGVFMNMTSEQTSITASNPSGIDSGLMFASVYDSGSFYYNDTVRPGLRLYFEISDKPDNASVYYMFSGSRVDSFNVTSSLAPVILKVTGAYA